MVKEVKKQFKIKVFSKFKLISFLFAFLLTTFYILPTTSAWAQFGFTNYLQNAPGGEYRVTWFFNILNDLTCYFIQFAIVAFGIMLIVYGLMFFKGRGTPQGMTEAKKALTWGLVGGFVIFAVFTIILSVVRLLEVEFATQVNFQITKMLICS